MTSICGVGDILKPFQGVLNALSKRQGGACLDLEPAPTANDQNCSAPTVTVKSMRRKTSREFHVWDRIKESVTTPGRLTADVQQLAGAIVPLPVEKEEPEVAPDPADLARSRTALARAKTTNSRLKSLEAYLSTSGVQTHDNV
jgi:hypothetical protein